MLFFTPWNLALAAVALLLVGVLVALARQRRRVDRQLPTEWVLSPRPVFNTEERRLYRQLREALPQNVILAKLPLVRFCHPADPQRVRYWYDLLGGSHVGFAICSASGRVLAALDVEGARAGSRRGQLIKQEVLSACRVRYLRCAPGELPSVSELQSLLPLPVLSSAMAPLVSPVDRTRERLSSTVATRRQQRNQHWPDSAFADSRFQDSTFSDSGGVDSRYGGLPSAAGGGGVVVDAPGAASRTRH